MTDQKRVPQPFSAQDKAYAAGLDNDTVEFGTEGPYETWDLDHTALVHVLWNAKHRGLTLAKDFDKIASLIMHSRWLAAQRADTTP